MEQFLIVKTSAIGDVIQSFHVVNLLKSRFPGCSVDWVVEKGIAPLLRAHPLVDQVLEIDTKLWRKKPLRSRFLVDSFRKNLRQKNYDALFDLQSNTKSAVVTIMAKARKKVGYSWEGVKEKPNYFATNVHLPIKEVNVRGKYAALIDNFFGKQEYPEPQYLKLKITEEEEGRLLDLAKLGADRPRIMVCFGSNWENKKLSIETLNQFLRMIPDAPSFLFIYGNGAEKRVADELATEFSGRGFAVGGMSLPLWQRLMWEVDAMITMDSASLHLCATTPTPTFSLFGPSYAPAFKPIGESHYAFQGICPYGERFDNRCPKLRTCKTGACLKGVSAQELMAHFEPFWERAATLRTIS
ncbi:MAG: glycosyltransferase family 9 protein [Verrucomicrobia bacterium]|nr:glycosyltransferase family 9 protein [Verrucomicrobiota bacterium]